MQETTFQPTLHYTTARHHNNHTNQGSRQELKRSNAFILNGYVQDACYVSKIDAIAFVLTKYPELNYYQRLPDEPSKNYSRVVVFSLTEQRIIASCGKRFFMSLRLIGTAYINDTQTIEYEYIQREIGLTRSYFYLDDRKLRRVRSISEHSLRFQRNSGEAHAITNSSFCKEIIYSSFYDYGIIDNDKGTQHCCYDRERIASLYSKEIVYPGWDTGTHAHITFRERQTYLRIREIYTSKVFQLPYSGAVAIAFEQDMYQPSIYVALDDGSIEQYHYESGDRFAIQKEKLLPKITQLFMESDYLVSIYSESNQGAVEIFNLNTKVVAFYEKFPQRIDLAKMINGKLLIATNKVFSLIHLRFLSKSLKESEKYKQEEEKKYASASSSSKNNVFFTTETQRH